MSFTSLLVSITRADDRLGFTQIVACLIHHGFVSTLTEIRDTAHICTISLRRDHRIRFSNRFEEATSVSQA